MKKPYFVLIGSGRFAFQLSSIARESLPLEGYKMFSYCRHSPTSGPTPFPRLAKLPEQYRYIIRVGKPYLRKQEADYIESREISGGAIPISLIARSTYIDKETRIHSESGAIIMPGTIVSAASILGMHCVIGSGSIIEHDCELANYTTLGPGCILTGSVVVRESSFIGAGTTVLPRLSIDHGAVIGAGSLVTNSVEALSLYYGRPARLIKRIDYSHSYI